MKNCVRAFLLLTLCIFASADDFAALVADRASLERVYHEHRTGTKQPFEQAMPRELIESLTRQELHKEAVLRKTYGVEITPAMLAAEVQRIHTTTRAPEMLAEIKHALGDDAGRFARTMARPILVERELRSRFDNDDRLHFAQRHEAEQARAGLLARKPVGGMREVTWQLTPRPAAAHASAAPAAPASTQVKASSGTYTVEATAQVAQVLAAPDGAGHEPGKEKAYFEDLDPELQKVLRVQLQKPGDVSAVVEMPAGFIIFQARERTAAALRAASLSIHKRSYEEWLAQQPD